MRVSTTETTATGAHCRSSKSRYLVWVFRGLIQLLLLLLQFGIFRGLILLLLQIRVLRGLTLLLLQFKVFRGLILLGLGFRGLGFGVQGLEFGVRDSCQSHKCHSLIRPGFAGPALSHGRVEVYLTRKVTAAVERICNKQAGHGPWLEPGFR